MVADLDRLAEVMARQRPAWEPGTRQAYHALTLGFYEGELMRRLDPRRRTLGQFFNDEIAAPLGEAVYIRLPEEIPNSRLAVLAAPGRVASLVGFPLRLTLEAMNPRSNIHRALIVNPGSSVYLDKRRVYARNLEVPPAMPSAPHAQSRMPTASSRPAAASWGCGTRRSTCWRLPPFRRAAASTTSASRRDGASSRWAS